MVGTQQGGGGPSPSTALAMALLLLVGLGAPLAGAAPTKEAAKLIAVDGEQEDHFGEAVDIDGDVAIIGATGDDDKGKNAGAAYLYERTASGDWALAAKVHASDAEASATFGTSVAISGDVAVVGADRYDIGGTDRGAAYVFERVGGVWIQTAQLLPDDWAPDDEFGHRVAAHQGTIAVAAWMDDVNGHASGSVYLYEKLGGSWTQTAKLDPNDGDAADLFGSSLALATDLLVVGARQDEAVAINAGSAYVFERSGSTWSQVAKLTASDGQAHDEFGRAAEVSSSTIVVGAWSDDVQGTDSGSAHIFEKRGGSWRHTAKLTPANGAADDRFGWRVAVEGSVVLVGAYRADGVGTNSGNAYLFQDGGSGWVQTARLVPADNDAWDYFGYDVALSGTSAIIGARGDDDRGSAAGAAYVYQETLPSQPEPEDTPQDDGGSGGDASDDPTDPTPMASSDSATYDFRGTLIPATDTIDAYGIDLAPSGTDVLNFTITPPNGYDLRLELIDPNGNVVDTSDQGGLGRPEHVEVGTPGTALVDGVWVLVIELLPTPNLSSGAVSLVPGLFDYDGKRRCDPRC